MEITHGPAMQCTSHLQLLQPLKKLGLQRLRYSFSPPYNLDFRKEGRNGQEGKHSFSNAENNRIVQLFCDDPYTSFLADGG